MSIENEDQKAFWENFAELWVTNQVGLDTLMAPVLDGVMQRADLKTGHRVLDVGCGTGTSTLIAAKAVGPSGHITGADISDPMLVRARAASTGVDNVQFETADVADHPFESAMFDQVISRFGTMFFNDPVKAFSNVHRAMKPGAQLTMACWSALDDNPWFQVPMYAAKKQLGAPPSLDPNAPGPLAFRDIERVNGILERAGFSNLKGQAQDLHLTPPGTIENVARHAASIGPAARTLEYFESSQEDFEQITASVAESFAPYMTDKGAQIPAQINFFTATAV